MSDQLNSALAALDQAAAATNILLRAQLAGVAPENAPRVQVLLQAAHGRLREARMLMEMSAGNNVWVHPLLDKLEDAICRGMQVANEVVFSSSIPAADEMSIDEMEAALVRNEVAVNALTQAEIAATAAMLHMTAALDLVVPAESTNQEGQQQ